MASRHEEKYIISYCDYCLLRSRAAQILTPDPHGRGGSYTITSVYYDDFFSTALYEKLDGLADHSKLRLRTYDHSDSFIRLERKDKHGILTEKTSARLKRGQLPLLEAAAKPLELSETAWSLAAQLRAGHLTPAVTVRYHRDAFFLPGTDLRLTFDTRLEAVAAEFEALFCPDYPGLPVLGGNQVIMEIKYGSFLPRFIRTLTDVDVTQLSVSKYALCRERFPI